MERRSDHLESLATRPDEALSAQRQASPPRAAPLRGMLRQIGHLVSGNTAAVVLGMVTLSFMAQMLGPALLGILAMIESYGRLVDQVVRLETWQAIIRYGAAALEADDERGFCDLIEFGIALDLLGAAAAGLVTLAAVPLVGAAIGWDQQTELMASLYAIAVAFGISSTPTGVLRLFDRFATIAWVDPVLAVFRLAAVAITWVLGGSLPELLAIAIVVPCVQRSVIAAMAWRELRRRGFTVRPSLGALRKGAAYPGIWMFTLSANGTVLLRKGTQELDILVIGAIAGPIGAGIYQVVRKFTLTAMKAGAMVQQVVYPNLARLWARHDLAGFTAAVRQIEMITVGVGIALVTGAVFIGDSALRIIAGPAFEDGHVPLIVQSVAGFLFLAGSALRPALMTIGLQPAVFRIAALSAVAFFATLYLATPALGISGAGVAHIVFNLIWLPACLRLFARRLREEHKALASG